MSVRLSRRGANAILLIDNPSRRNAMSRGMWESLPVLLAQAEADEQVAVISLVGAGNHFCSGADIADFASAYATPTAAAESNQAIRLAVEALARCAKPTVARIRGACIGGGVALALACDVRLGAVDARFAVTPVRLGLIYSQGDTVRLMRAVGASRAREMLFSARSVESEEALRIGLLDRLWPDAGFEAAADAYLDSLCAASRPALRAVRSMIAAIQAGARHDDPSLDAMFDQRFQAPDFAEGYDAFLTKRPPRFTER